MSLSSAVSRLTEYLRRHGLAATVRRAGLAARRSIFAGRMVVFYCDLGAAKLRQVSIPTTVAVERIRSLTDFSEERFKEITAFWNPKLASRNIRERFGKGASLWLVECEGRLVGYGWTLQGGTIEPYYFPLAQDDVHLFDFHVFPDYRGRGINPCLVSFILESLADNCHGRAFIEAAEWNEAQLSSLRKTSFRCLGAAKAFMIFGHTYVSWSGTQDDRRNALEAKPGDPVLRTTRSNER